MTVSRQYTFLSNVHGESTQKFLFGSLNFIGDVPLALGSQTVFQRLEQCSLNAYPWH